MEQAMSQLTFLEKMLQYTMAVVGAQQHPVPLLLQPLIQHFHFREEKTYVIL